jgi:hypothetical protein
MQLMKNYFYYLPGDIATIKHRCVAHLYSNATMKLQSSPLVVGQRPTTAVIIIFLAKAQRRYVAALRLCEKIVNREHFIVNCQLSFINSPHSPFTIHHSPL